MKKRIRSIAWIAALSLSWAGSAAAAESGASVSPYIDSIKQELPPEKDGAAKNSGQVDPYIQSLKRKQQQAPQPEGTLPPGESYTEMLKRTNPDLSPKKESSYSDQMKSQLGGKKTGGAIEAYKQGKSELKPRIEGDIHNGIGLRYGISLNRDITASADIASRSFDAVYGSKYAPDVSLYYEYQPWHHETYGNFGAMFITGLSYFRGTGTFAVQIQRPGSTEYFPSQSKTNFDFYLVPLTVGASYRLNVTNFIRPFAMVGPSFQFYKESRSDNVKGGGGVSKALFVDVGVSFLLDWLSRDSSWDLYSAWGIKHYFLNVEYSRYNSFASDVDFNISGLTLGLGFEF